VTLKAGTTTVGTYTLTQTEITNGNVTITASALGAQNTYELKAYVSDLAGNVGSDSTAISYVFDSTNNAPTASFVSATSTSFTILASDVDVEPNWSTLVLGTAINGVSSLTDGSNTAINVQQQVISVVTNLTTTDGSNSVQVYAQTDKTVTVIQGTAGDDTFNAVASTVVGVYYGFEGDDVITGGVNGDYIFSGDGNDTVTGRAGNDTITLGAGNDTVRFNSLIGVDTVTDYTPSDDLIQLAISVFTGLTTATNNTLSAAEFVSGANLTAATTADQRIVYNTTTGALYYDADGSGATGAVQIAILTNGLTMTNSEFFIV